MNKMRCSITDDWTYKGMRVVFLENTFLRVGILVDRGSDIFEFRYKPLDVDPLLRLPKGILNPAQDFSQMRDTKNQMEDYYYGGWQEMLPNGPSFTYRGASLGQHGEVSLAPWKYSVIKSGPDEVILKVWTRTLRMPLLIEKTFTLKEGEATLHIDERLTNEGKTTLDIMWGHHIAFGLPFMEEGVHVETNAKTFMAEPSMPPDRKFKSGKEFIWPMGESINEKSVDASRIGDVTAGSYSELCYLQGYPQQAFYSVKSKRFNIAFTLQWDGDLFPCAWLWEERYSTMDFPWWGKCYTVAVEPWTSPWTKDPERAIANKEWKMIGPEETITTSLQARIDASIYLFDK
jgi:hypothetical protein